MNKLQTCPCNPLQPHYCNQAEIARLREENERLTAWKESAITLLAAYQRVAEKFPANIGDSWVNILERGVEALESRLAQVREALKRHGHNGLCGILIGDDTLCSSCRALEEP